jgi:hypothetical protein
MQITDHTLAIDDMSFPLPKLTRKAIVKAWRVPKDYRSDGVFFAVTPIGDAEEVPACDPSQCVLIGALDLDPHPDALLEEAKNRKKEAIEAERDEKCCLPVAVHGRQWQADKRSQELLAAAITLAQAGCPLPAVWRDLDNNDMPVDGIDDLVAISAAIAAQVQAVYAESWQRKAAVDAAQSLDEINAA